MGHGVITDNFYDHPKIKVLEREGKHLAAYLCANRNTHYSGLYYLPVTDVARDLSIPELDVRYWIEVLEAGPGRAGPVDKSPGPCAWGYFIEFDWERSLVWVRGMLKARMSPSGAPWGLSDKQRTGMQKYLARFNNSPLVGRFVSFYESVSIPLPMGYGIPHPEGVSGTLFGRGTRTKVLRFKE